MSDRSCSSLASWWRACFDDIVRSRVEIMRLLPSAGWGLIAASAGVNVALGVLPLAFIIATSMMLGRVPAAVAAGVGSGAWNELIAAFSAAAGFFLAQQALSSLQGSLRELVTRRVDGYGWPTG